MWFYILLLVVANVLWAGSYSVMKWAVVDIPPLTLAFYRFAISAIILSAIALVKFRKKLFEIKRLPVVRLLVVSLLNIFHQVGLYFGVQFTNAADASLIASMEPVFLFFLATLILREDVRLRHILAVFTGLIGFLVISGLQDFSFAGSLLFGNMLVFFAVVSESCFSIFSKPLARKYSAVVMMAIITIVQTIILAPIAYIYDPLLFSPIITSKMIIVVAYLAIFCTVFGYTIWIVIMRKVPVNLMALTLFLQPVLGPIIAALFLGEVLGMRLIIGGIIILLSLYIALSRELSPHKKRHDFDLVEKNRQNSV